MSIRIECFNDDPKAVELCQKYWQTNEDGKFHYHVKEIDPQSSQHYITAFVAAHCYAYDPEYRCPSCGDSFVYNSRTEYLKFIRSHNKGICSDCARIEAQRMEKE